MRRVHHEEVVRRYDAWLAAETRRYDSLMSMYHTLKVQGAVAAPPSIAPQVMLAKQERDDVFDAIELQAGGDTTLRRHLTRWAKTRQLEGMDPTEIINAILHWQSDDDDYTGVVTLQ